MEDTSVEPDPDDVEPEEPDPVDVEPEEPDPVDVEPEAVETDGEPVVQAT
jgi:hypothetical protein